MVRKYYPMVTGYYFLNKHKYFLVKLTHLLNTKAEQKDKHKLMLGTIVSVEAIMVGKKKKKKNAKTINLLGDVLFIVQHPPPIMYHQSGVVLITSQAVQLVLLHCHSSLQILK